jgi:cytochrome bd-type quinol oxidase subunit 2
MKKTLTKIATSITGAIIALQSMSGLALAVEAGETIEPGKGFADNIGSLINGLLGFVMLIAALLVFLYLILGGIEWITSGGDSSKTEKARNKITAAVVGLVILAASYAVLLIVINFLGFSNLEEVFSNAGGIGGK